MRYKVDELINVKAIGKTAMMVVRPCEGLGEIAFKLEGNGLGGSIKDRTAWGMLRRAEELGELRDDTVIVEPTSGNTGIALAMLGRSLGLSVVLTMPESMSRERRDLLTAYGARLELTSGERGMVGAMERAKEIAEEDPRALMVDQFSNPGNPWAHQVTTGPEILQELWGRRIDGFVAGVGTGGTLTGTARALKPVHHSLRVVAVEPASSPVLSGGEVAPHGIQGIGAGFIPPVLDRSLVDEVTTVTDSEAREGTRELLARWGIFSGISSGANYMAALKLAKEVGPDGLVVTVLPDRGDKYISTGVFSA
nr:cysteine synthase A [uncultured Dethiosulfovibrio sp.]